MSRSSKEELRYTEGPVIHMEMVRIKPGYFEEYMKFLATEWKTRNEAFKKEGLIESYRIITAPPSDREDWDVMLVHEYKNMAVFDGLYDKIRRILNKIDDSFPKMEETEAKRNGIREVVGERIGRELILN
jgi:hypothetical protein